MKILYLESLKIAIETYVRNTVVDESLLQSEERRWGV